MEPTDRNLRAWEAAHDPRTAPGGPPSIPEHVRDRLPDVDGRHVLHLGCSTGEETAELAGRGALVTGVDASEEALAPARARWPGIAWVHADPSALPLELRHGRFDLVYAGGDLAAVRDLDGWAAGVHAALRRGGFLLLWDAHPVAGCLDGFLHWRADYFEAEAGDERRWPLGRLVTALAQAGLVLRRLEELPDLRSWRPLDERVPGELVLVARR